MNWILGENPGFREKICSAIVGKLSFHCNLICSLQTNGTGCGLVPFFYSLNYSSSQKRLTKARASKITG